MLSGNGALVSTDVVCVFALAYDWVKTAQIYWLRKLLICVLSARAEMPERVLGARAETPERVLENQNAFWARVLAFQNAFN